MTNIYNEMQEGYKQLNSWTGGIENQTKEINAKIDTKLYLK